MHGLRDYAADKNIAYAEGMARAAGCGTHGATSQEAANIAADMLDGIKALCDWVSSWFD